MKNRTSNRLKKGSLFGLLGSFSHLATTMSALWTFFLGLSLFSYNPHDPSWFYYSSAPLPLTNYAGPLGAQVAAFCFYMWGKAAYALLGIGVYGTCMLFKKRTLEDEFERLCALVSLPFTWSTLLSFHAFGHKPYMLAGGYLGTEFFSWLVSVCDMPGAVVVLYGLLFCQFLLISRLSGIAVVGYLFVGGVHFLRTYRIWLRPLIKLMIAAQKGLRWIFRSIHTLYKKIVEIVANALFGKEKKEQEEQRSREQAPFTQLFWQEQQQKIDQTTNVQESLVKNVEEKSLLHEQEHEKKNGFNLPEGHFFAKTVHDERLAKHDESKQTAALLQEKLARLGIAGNVVGTRKGPVVTLFEFQPDIDTKLSKIIPLEQDLALALEAMSVRIVAPIPGTPHVGFEVSNKERLSVKFGDIITSTAYKKSNAALPLILGQDTTGFQVIVDLADMPHLLVAGSTGSGKSIALNTMLISLLCRLTPDQLRLIIVDPKRLEFAAYHDIPHLLFPIITEPHRAAPVIRWLVKLMEDRYQLMAQQGVRSIHEYKQACIKEKKKDELPFIVLMIDELADLMMVAGKESEEGIARLAQMARAAGIHLIVATQRPSVDVVTGVIKVNFPSRISFRLTSKIDSRTILDAAGAESLLGKGDMLFMDAQTARMRRVHGAYVSDAEIKKVTDHLRAQGLAHYVDLQDVVALYESHHQELEEPLLKEVLVFLQTVDDVSISLLQRRFKIGYNRSARVIELLEQQGKIMPADGSKMRKVIH